MSVKNQGDEKPAPRWLVRTASLWVLWFALVTLTIYLGTHISEARLWDRQRIGTFALLVSALSTAVFIVGRRSSALGFAGTYFLYLSIAHLGIVISDLFSPGILLRLDLSWTHWYYSAAAHFAIVLSSVAVGCFALAAVLSSYLLRPTQKPRITLDRAEAPALFAVGAVLLVVSALYHIYAVATGLFPLFGSYDRYWEGLQVATGYNWIRFALALGLTFILATGDSRQRRVGLWIFGISALLLLLTGNRGEVLYPAAAGVAILRCRGYRLNTRSVVAFLLVFFVAIPAIRQLRQTSSIAEARGSSFSFHVAEPFCEIGHTLRPLVHTREWIEQRERFAAGQTYILPVRRLLASIFPFLTRPALEGRLDVRNRLWGEGYSVVAEAYFNFDIRGVVVIMIVLALFLTTLGDGARSQYQLALIGGIQAVLVNNVRNAFVFVPGQILIVVLLVGGLAILSRYPMRSRVRPRLPVRAS